MTDLEVKKGSLSDKIPDEDIPYIKDMPKEKYDLFISSLLMRIKEYYKDKK